MTVRDAIHIFQSSQKNLHRKRTTDSYRYILEHFKNHFTDSHVEGITISKTDIIDKVGGVCHSND